MHSVRYDAYPIRLVSKPATTIVRSSFTRYVFWLSLLVVRVEPTAGTLSCLRR